SICQRRKRSRGTRARPASGQQAYARSPPAGSSRKSTSSLCPSPQASQTTEAALSAGRSTPRASSRSRAPSGQADTSSQAKRGSAPSARPQTGRSGSVTVDPQTLQVLLPDLAQRLRLALEVAGVGEGHGERQRLGPAPPAGHEAQVDHRLGDTK